MNHPLNFPGHVDKDEKLKALFSMLNLLMPTEIVRSSISKVAESTLITLFIAVYCIHMPRQILLSRKCPATICLGALMGTNMGSRVLSVKLVSVSNGELRREDLTEILPTSHELHHNLALRT
jgi:hypothetical protein